MDPYNLKSPYDLSEALQASLALSVAKWCLNRAPIEGVDPAPTDDEQDTLSWEIVNRAPTGEDDEPTDVMAMAMAEKFLANDATEYLKDMRVEMKIKSLLHGVLGVSQSAVNAHLYALIISNSALAANSRHLISVLIAEHQCDRNRLCVALGSCVASEVADAGAELDRDQMAIQYLQRHNPHDAEPIMEWVKQHIKKTEASIARFASMKAKAAQSTDNEAPPEKGDEA